MLNKCTQKTYAVTVLCMIMLCNAKLCMIALCIVILCSGEHMNFVHAHISEADAFARAVSPFVLALCLFGSFGFRCTYGANVDIAPASPEQLFSDLFKERIPAAA